MKRWTFFVYGVISYLGFLAIYAWMAGFVGNFLVPKSIDTPSSSIGSALAVNFVLIALFGLSHSIMARPRFKKHWTKLVPPPIERSTYVMVANLFTVLLMWQWRGIDITIWDVQQPVARLFLWALFAVGWLLVPAASLMIDHFDLFGLRQVLAHLQNRDSAAQPFRTPMLYGQVRHPLYLGWFLALWATPTMTVGHLLLAGGLTGYIAIAVIFEERDLVNHFGQEYREYQRRVPRFIPRLVGGFSRQSTPESEAIAK